MLDERCHLRQIAAWLFDSAADDIVQATYRRFMSMIIAHSAMASWCPGSRSSSRTQRRGR